MTNHHSITPLRQRMIDDMRLRKLSPKTQTGYLRAVVKFTRFFGRSPDLASPEDLRAFQLQLVEEGVSPTTINATLTGLTFLFGITLERPSALKRMSRVRQPQKLPQVLSVDEVARLLAGSKNPKHRAALAVAYGAGLRANEVVHLKITDIDSERMIVRVNQGKGRRDRYAMLSPSLLELLRAWWRHGHAQGKMLQGGWLFPGRKPVNPLSTRQLNTACHLAADAAGLKRRVSMHTLRHSFATHLLPSSFAAFSFTCCRQASIVSVTTGSSPTTPGLNTCNDCGNCSARTASMPSQQQIPLTMIDRQPPTPAQTAVHP